MPTGRRLLLDAGVMKYRLSQISNLKRAEKLALGLLRGATDVRAPVEATAAFQQFNRHLVDSGDIIQHADALTVHADEFRALGLLATLQRDRSASASRAPRSLIACAQRCAGLLDDMGYRLEYRLVSYLQTVPRGTPEWRVATNSKELLAEDNSSALAKAAARQRLLEIAARDGVIRTIDIRKMGLPQDILRKLVRQRSLRRIARGVYAPNTPKH